jgi:hypothetical protein
MGVGVRARVRARARVVQGTEKGVEKWEKGMGRQGIK